MLSYQYSKKYVKRFIPVTIIIISLFLSCKIIFFLSPKPLLLEGIPFSKVVYDENNHVLRLCLSNDEKYRLYTPLSQISKELVETTLLQEDRYYYWHGGFNLLSLVRAIWETYVVKSRRVGASTITMQVARLRFGIQSKKPIGKLQQIIKALQLEAHYTKAQILEAYLNLAPYGGNIEGIGAASLVYFNQPAKAINLPQSLNLTLIPQNPSKRSFFKEANLQTLKNHLFKEWLHKHPNETPISMQAMVNLPLAQTTLKSMPFLAPHLVTSLLKEPRNKALELHTLLNIKLQQAMEHKVQQYLKRQKNYGVNNAAILLVDTRDMGVKVAIGSADFYNTAISGQINGIDIKRSPGSTLKPFIYALAFDQGLIHPYTVLKDVPRRFGTYNPENFDNDFMGPLKAKDALILSRNIPAIELANRLSSPNLFNLLEEAEVSQLRPPSYYGLSLSLGGAEVTMTELTALYAMLANHGIWHPLRFTQDEKIAKGKRLLSPEASFLTIDSLTQTPRPSSYQTLNPFPIAWKTGTSSGFRDAWTVGIVGPYVLTVWLGHFNNQSNPAFVGKTMAAPLFFELTDVLRHTLSPLPTLENDPTFMNLKKIAVCSASGMLPTTACPLLEKTWFIPGKSPIKTDTIYREIAIDKQTGLRTCHINQDTQFKIYEFWPSDLSHLFKQAGIKRRTPPPLFARLYIKRKARHKPSNHFSTIRDHLHCTYVKQPSNNHSVYCSY